ncbi:MAG: hypothetical protein ACTSRY_03930 [Alphaproteobacteria bacterium]
MAEVFRVRPRHWRGVGEIAASRRHGQG